MNPIVPRMPTSRIITDLVPIKIGMPAVLFQKRPLEIPKVELSASQKEELNSQRAERRDFNKDAEKDSKRSLRKNSPEPE